MVRKLEEKERILQNSLATVEKELAVRQQALEMHKRKAIESAQSAADLKLHLGLLNQLIAIGLFLFFSQVLERGIIWFETLMQKCVIALNRTDVLFNSLTLFKGI